MLINQNIMKKNQLLILILLITFSSGFAQKLWNKTSDSNIEETVKSDRTSMPGKYILYSLDIDVLKTQLLQAPLDNSGIKSNVELEFPNPDGGFEKYSFYESPIMEKGLADQFPDIKTYSAIGIDNPTAKMRVSFTQFGLHAMIIAGDLSTVYIDTYTKDLNNFIVYRKSDITSTRLFECFFDNANSKKTEETLKNSLPQQRLSDGFFRIYRLAVACTGEYATFHGGTIAGAQAAIVVTVNRINLVYERDFSVKFSLVANNTSILYTDAATDPFNNTDANVLINQSQSQITATIGSGNFDIGHTVSTGGGGLAGLGVICVDSQKASGITGSGAPVGDPFDIDYVAHELGHQFGCNHTFNNFCGGNRNNGTAVEPGSGSTVMAYAGICAPNVQSLSNDYFSFISIQEAQAVILGTSCPIKSVNGNFAPIVEAGLDYTIPNGTAYILRGAATDANSDALTYCWEQNNSEVSTQAPISTSIVGPNYRSNVPSTSPNRYMPNLTSVIANNLAPTWEVTPTVARTMKFALTVRDNRSPNGGQTGRDDMIVTTAAVGPFLVNSPNTAVSWVAGTNQTVTWAVAGTTINNINAAFVDILLSNDGGNTYPIVLASKVPNDGSETITVPNNVGATKRIMVRGYKHIFYDISNTNFSITAPVSSFTIAFSGVEEQQNKSACQGNNITYNISYVALGGFTGTTTLSASGLPTGATASFVPATISANGNVVMTISTATTSPAGNYNIIVTGTSGASIKTAPFYLELISNTFPAMVLSAPANNATNQATILSLSWDANANADSYDVQVATNSTFTTIISSGTVSTTTYPLTGLSTNTNYFWRVLPKNSLCGIAVYSSPFTFTTGAVGCNVIASPNVPVVISASGTPTITSTINITSGGTILDLDVTTQISHNYISDVSITLTSPGGITANLVNNVCESNANINATFDDAGTALICGTDPAISGIILPGSALSVFNGTNCLGLWTLTISDNTDQDGGSLTAWNLKICSNVTPLNEDVFQDFSLFPNPNKGNFNIKFTTQSSGDITIAVIDMRGRDIYQKLYSNKSTFNQNINLENIQAGMYLVTITKGSKKIVRKIIIE